MDHSSEVGHSPEVDHSSEGTEVTEMTAVEEQGSAVIESELRSADGDVYTVRLKYDAAAEIP
jgi:hypothetical protein